MAQVRFGYKASAEQFGPRELLDYAVLAEQVGFDSVVISCTAPTGTVDLVTTTVPGFITLASSRTASKTKVRSA